MRSRFRASVAGLVCVGTALGAVMLSSGPSQAASRTVTEPYYVSLGDSYAIGYQPGIGPTTGYTGVVAKQLHMQLENFGCGGATTTSILNSIGCGAPAGIDAVPYPSQTQAAAAVAFITAHPGQIGLVTVSIGGNDITACAANADPVACVEAAAATISTNVTTLAGDLRAATGTGVPIIGLTYPDVILGEWVANPPNQTLATESVTAFQEIVNPTLKSAYASAAGEFVDVTQHTGAYIPLTKTTKTATYGVIPKAVAKVCQLTYFCSVGDIHAHTKGYSIIGHLTVREFGGKLH
jgi:lysophospholipase L1-like esterase